MQNELKCVLYPAPRGVQVRTLLLVEDVEQDNADLVVGLDVVVQQHRDDALHGVSQGLPLRVRAHGQVLAGQDVTSQASVYTGM